MQKIHYGVAMALIGATMWSVPSYAQEVIVNGGFEADGVETTSPQGWATQEVGISGAVLATTGTTSPISAYSTVGAASGSFYGLLDTAFPSNQVLYQSFSVSAGNAATLSFQMFVNDQSEFATVYINNAGLDHTTGGSYAPNQHVRVDLLKAGADLFSTQSADIAGTYYLGGANSFRVVDADMVNPYVSYSFDISNALASGGDYTLRFATVGNMGALQMGVDNVSLSVSAVPEADTYAMMLSGLGLMGLVVRRRRNISI